MSRNFSLLLMHGRIAAMEAVPAIASEVATGPPAILSTRHALMGVAVATALADVKALRQAAGNK